MSKVGTVIIASALSAGVALAGGVALGLSQRPEPEVVTEVVKEPVAVPTTPAVCADALAEAERAILTADEMIDHFEEYKTLAADAVRAAAARDLDQMQELTTAFAEMHEEMDATTADIEDNEYVTLRDECLRH